MKEETAKTKLCPQLQIGHMITLLSPIMLMASGQTEGSAELLERLDDLNGVTMCRGSGCAMWEADLKWETVYDKEGLEPPVGNVWERLNKRPVLHHNRETTYVCNWRRVVEQDTGDCGLKTKELICNGGN